MNISILSCESSHAEIYAEIIDRKRYGVVTNIWDENSEIAVQKSSLLGCQYNPVMKNNIIDTDFVLIEGRYADSHFEPAMQSVSNGIPTYIDKPAVINLEQAYSLSFMANKLYVPLVSFTPLFCSKEFKEFSEKTKLYKTFYISAPGYCNLISDEKANEFSFYGSHAIDLLTRLIEEDPIEIITYRIQNSFQCTIFFENGYIGNLLFTIKSDEFYHLLAFNGSSTIFKSIDPYGDYCERTIDYLFNEFLEGGWKKDQFSATVRSMWILDQINSKLKNEKN